MNSFSATSSQVTSSQGSSSDTGANSQPHCLAIQALAEPGLIERVVGQLSKRGFVPSRLVSTLEGEQMVLDVQVVGLEDGVARHLAQWLRSLPGVDSVLLCLRNGVPAE
ncbi:hypothetical protein [Rhodospirillum sp. A1_3_36]|uniref:hypothetical protein n=1 Tax=Rhodospirillum sp. A1_3_36 TaxID=3391666 RepID=UPI0039A48FFA